MEMVTIKTFDNYFTANIILSKLGDAGINGYLKDEYTVTIDPMLSNAIGGIKLTVNAEDAGQAMKLLSVFEDEYRKSIICPKCSSNNISLISKPGAVNFITTIFTWFFSNYAVAPEKIYQCQNCQYESKTLPVNYSDEVDSEIKKPELQSPFHFYI